jgi:hypothetical protein
MNTQTKPPILEGCAVLPPMHQANGNGSPRQRQGDTAKAKGKPGRRKTADRFAVLNAFVDFTIAGLTRNEIAAWLVLWRDTKPDGTARTSQVDLARRVGVTDRTVRNVLGQLAEKGLLRVVYRGGIGRGASRYRVWSVPPDR